MHNDTELLRCYAEEKSEAAFAEIVRRQLDLVYSAALRRLGGDAHGAADVAQVVFARLARDATRLSRHTVLTAWLYSVTRNAAVDAIRADVRRQRREQEAHTMQTILAPGPADAAWEKLRPVLDATLDELAQVDREAVLLRFFEQRGFAEIGATLRVSEDAARMRVERALEKLRGALARRGVTSTGAALGVVLANQAVGAAPAGLAGTVVAAAVAASAAVVGVVGGGATMAEVFTFMSTG